MTKQGNLYLIIGQTGTGKTTFAKNMLLSKPRHLVFDVNNEYPELPEYTGEKLPAKYTKCDAVEFMGLVYNEETKEPIIRGAFILVEDATGFFMGRQSETTIRILQGKRHAQNDYAFLFHSINSVPPRLYEFANFICLFKTNDSETRIKQKYPRLLRPFLELKQAPGRHAKKLIKNNA